MRCINQKHLGKRVCVFNCDDFDLRVYKVGGTDLYDVMMIYNPWHERLDGWFCSSLCNLSDRQINVIISQFGFGMDIEGLPKEMPSIHVERFDDTVDTADMYAFA